MDGHKTFGNYETVCYLDYDHSFIGICPYHNFMCSLHKLYLNKAVKERKKKGLIYTVTWINFEIIVLRGRFRHRIVHTV